MDGTIREDYDYFHANYDEIYSKHNNEFVAVKNLKFYHYANPLNLIKLLRVDGLETKHNFAGFLK